MTPAAAFRVPGLRVPEGQGPRTVLTHVPGIRRPDEADPHGCPAAPSAPPTQASVSLGRRPNGPPLRIVLGLLQAFLSLAPAVVAGELWPVVPTQPSALLLPDLGGQERGLEELRGKVVLVNFWASWCAPCIAEMPSIQRLAEAMRGRPFAVVTVNVGEGELRAKAMVERLGLGLPVLLDKDSAVFDRWQATVLPTTYLIDAAGVPRFVGRGPLEWDGVEAGELVSRLLDEAAAQADANPERP